VVVKPRTKAAEVVLGASNCSVLAFGKSTFLSRLLDQHGTSVSPVPKAGEQGSRGAGGEFERVGYFCQPTIANLDGRENRN
jgi:hypothetical protein